MQNRGSLIAQLSAGMLDEGDFHYRNYAPGYALSRAEGVYVVSLSQQHPLREKIMSAADMVVLHMVHDPGIGPLLQSRKNRGRACVYEISDDIDSPSGWDPLDKGIAAVRRRMKDFAGLCDAVQFPSLPLEAKYGRMAPLSAVFPNQMLIIPPERKIRRKDELVVGWGGSLTHLGDMAEIAGPLTRWMLSRNDAKLRLACADPIWELFRDMPPDRKERFPTGSIADYYRFLDSLDVGLGPLRDTGFNIARTDVKYLEYAARGVVAVMQAAGPYPGTVKSGTNGFLYGDVHELVRILDEIAGNVGVRVRTALAARQYVVDERNQLVHFKERLDFYKAVSGADPGSGNEGNWGRGGPAGEFFERLSRVPGAMPNGRHMVLI